MKLRKDGDGRNGCGEDRNKIENRSDRSAIGRKPSLPPKSQFAGYETWEDRRGQWHPRQILTSRLVRLDGGGTVSERRGEKGKGWEQVGSACPSTSTPADISGHLTTRLGPFTKPESHVVAEMAGGAPQKRRKGRHEGRPNYGFRTLRRGCIYIVIAESFSTIEAPHVYNCVAF